MENKEEYCEQLKKKWKDLIPKIPKVEPGSSSPEFRSNTEERNAIIIRLRKECWECLSDRDRFEIREKFIKILLERIKKAFEELKRKLNLEELKYHKIIPDLEKSLDDPGALIQLYRSNSHKIEGPEDVTKNIWMHFVKANDHHEHLWMAFNDLEDAWHEFQEEKYKYKN